MKLNLIHSRHDFTGRISQKLLQVANLEVGDPDVPGPATLQELLHFLPAFIISLMFVVQHRHMLTRSSRNSSHLNAS